MSECIFFTPASTCHSADLSLYAGFTVTRCASFDVFTAMRLRIPFLWYVTLRRRKCYGFPTFWWNSRLLKVKALHSFGTLEGNYPVTQRHISAEQNLWTILVDWWGVIDRVINGRSAAEEIVIKCENDWLGKYEIEFKYPSRTFGTNFPKCVAICQTDETPLSASSYFPSLVTKV